MKIQKFNEENTYTDAESELWQEFYNLIAEDWCKHEDDYPYVEQTADECLEIVKRYINKK